MISLSVTILMTILVFAAFVVDLASCVVMVRGVFGPGPSGVPLIGLLLVAAAMLLGYAADLLDRETARMWWRRNALFHVTVQLLLPASLCLIFAGLKRWTGASAHSPEGREPDSSDVDSASPDRQKT